MNHGRCVCLLSKWLHCDMDCCTCPHRTSGDISYLDDSRVDDEGNEMTWLDHLQEKMPDLQSPSFADGLYGISLSCFSPFRSLLFRFSGIGVRGFPCKRAKDIFALCLRERRRCISVNNPWHWTDCCQYISTYHIPSSDAAKSACAYGFHVFFTANICLILYAVKLAVIQAIAVALPLNITVTMTVVQKYFCQVQ